LRLVEQEITQEIYIYKYIKIWQTKTSDGCNYNRRRLRFVNIFDFEPALLRANKVSFTRKISIEASQPDLGNEMPILH